jgi:hypothetical protein
MDIQNLRSFLTPETWQALKQYFKKEILQKLQDDNSAVTAPAPAPAPIRRTSRASIGRALALPPPLDTSLLAYIPKAIPKMKRSHPAVALRRDFIGEALRKNPAGATYEEILEHLAAAKFPVDDSYYGALVSGEPRIWSSISNDLHFFLDAHWVRQVGGGRWKWVRSKD